MAQSEQRLPPIANDGEIREIPEGSGRRFKFDGKVGVWRRTTEQWQSPQTTQAPERAVPRAQPARPAQPAPQPTPRAQPTQQRITPTPPAQAVQPAQAAQVRPTAPPSPYRGVRRPPPRPTRQ